MLLGKYETNNIYNVDSYKAIKELPDKCIDLIVTDPPYDLDTEGSKRNNISKTFSNCNAQISNISEGIDVVILEEFMRIMKKPNIYIWCNKKQIPLYLDFFVTKHKCKFEIMVWIKNNPTPLCGGNYLIDKEFCLYFRDGVKLNTTFESASTYWITPKNKKDKDKFQHPTIKPLDLVKRHLLHTTQPNDIIADFFMGSGTTCVASKELNRQYLGFEINKKWYDIASDRLNNVDANGQTSMFLL